MMSVPRFRKHDRYKASSYRAYNDTLLARYDTMFWHRICQTALYDRTVVEELGSSLASLRILDVGCATGRLLAHLAAAGASDLAGTDLAPRILEVARQKLTAIGARAELMSADVEDRLPWPAESFDIVILMGVLHHLTRPRDALDEIHRVLRPCARLLLVDPSWVFPIRHVFNLALRLVPHWGDHRFYTLAETFSLLGNAKWSDLRSRRVGWTSYLVSAVKAVPNRTASLDPAMTIRE